jgi:hypothetical protein
MKIKWWEITAIIALLGAMMSLCYAEIVGFASDIAGWLWLGSAIIGTVALPGRQSAQGWKDSEANSAHRRWRAALRSCRYVWLLIIAIHMSPPLRGYTNGPFCQIGDAMHMVCPPLWYSIVTFAPVMVVSSLLLIYGSWLRKQNPVVASGQMV